MALSLLCIPSRDFSGAGRQISIQHPEVTMTSTSRQKRTAPELGSGINELIAACNKNDRFKLLENDRVLSGNLDNPIHSVFSGLDQDGTMKQMLQLASHFLTHDTLLTFFIPLLYGRELTGVVGGTCKIYLSDPLTTASKEKDRKSVV